MTKKRKRIATAAVLAAILIASVGYGIHSRRAKETPVQAGTVELRERLIAKVSASGVIRPKEYVELQAEIAGVITQLYVREGDRVAQGDILLRIDPTQMDADMRAQQALLDVALAEASNQRAQISLQETQLRRDRADLRLAEAELDRARRRLQLVGNSFDRTARLYEDRLVPRDSFELARDELLTAETSLVTAEARLEQARAQLEVAEVVLEQTRTSYEGALSRVAQNRALLERTQDLLQKTILRAPLDGVVTRLNVEAGERAVPGTLNNPAATLMEIANLSIIEAELRVDETDIVEVEVGQRAEVRVDALPDQPLRGTVTEVGSSTLQRTVQQSQQEARDFKVVIRLEDPSPRLRPGLSCTADITTAVRSDVLTIPIQALTLREFRVDSEGRPVRARETGADGTSGDSGERTFRRPFQGVFRVHNGRVEFVPIETGITGETEMEALSGVERGTTIVTGPFRTLRTLSDGEAVRIESGGGNSR